MDNEDAVKGNNRRNDNSEKKPRLGLLKKLKENKEEANDSSISPIKNNREMHDKANQSKNKDNKSIMQKLLESKRKKELLKNQYESASSTGIASKDNNKDDQEEENRNSPSNADQNEHNNEDEHSNSNEDDNVSCAKQKQKSQTSLNTANNNNSTNNNNNITNRLKKLFQAKVDEIENSKPQSQSRDSKNDDNNDDEENNNSTSNNNNEESPAKEPDTKQQQQPQLSKAELRKMALSNKKAKQTDTNTVEAKAPLLSQTPKKSPPTEATNNNTTNTDAPSSSYGFVSQNASSKKSNEVKNILELIKQKKTQKEKLQRSFEMEQQHHQPEEQKSPRKEDSPAHSNNSSNNNQPNEDDEEEEKKFQRAKFKEMMLQKEAAAQKQKQIQVEEERKIREKVRKEQEEKLRVEAEKRRKALEEEERIRREKEEKELQLQLEAQKLELQRQEEERRRKEEEEKRKKLLEEEEKKQREETRKLLLEELRKEVTKEITESVKKEFEEKVKKQQEELEEKEKALIEREREAQEKLQLSQNQSQLDNTQTTDEDDKRKKHPQNQFYKQPKNIYANNSQSAMNIPTYNNNQQQQQPIYGNSNNNNNRDEQSFDSIPANAIKRPYYKKQNHLMIYNKKPGLRGRSAEKVNPNPPPLNTNPNSLNNTQFYGSPKHFMQQDYNNGIVNNYQHIEQQHYSTLNNNIYNTHKSPGRFGIEMNSTNTTKTSRYMNNSPINRSNIDNSYLYGNNNTSNNLSTYNFINPFQYNDFSQMPPPSSYNNNNNSIYQQQSMPTNIYRQPESLSMNFEDLLLFEQKLMDILRDFIEEKPMTNECFEWWNYDFNCSLYKQLEKTFKSEAARSIVQESINYQLLSIIICYDVSSKPYVFDQVKVMIKPILIYNHHNLILIYENILSKVSSESINNIWVKKLSNLIYTVKSSPHNEMNPDSVFLNSPEPYDKLNEVDKIEFNTRSIIGNIRILLKNYSDGETTDVLVALFKTIKHKSYEDINDIFLSKILRVDNPNGSVLASVLIRDNAYFSTVEAPYLKNPSVRPYTLVLDLDETIIHFKINEHNDTEGVLQVRPGIQDFLVTLGQYYEIVIFTAATQDYADLLIEELEENTFYFDYKLYRQHTIIIGNNFVKDLTRLGRSLDKVIIVDNMPQNFRLQKENGIHIRPFWGDDAQDTALIELQPILLNIAKEGGDVRKGLRKYKDEIMNKVTMNQTDRN